LTAACTAERSLYIQLVCGLMTDQTLFPFQASVKGANHEFL